MLSDRLMMMASKVENGQSFLDVGTDHGYLPIYLAKENISEKILLSDVSKGSLNKARKNCKEILPEFKFDFRCGNGLKVIRKGEIDVIAIAGMGGNLITEILGKDLGKARSCKKIILQPRNSSGRLRAWLIKKGFNISSEDLVREGKFICEVIVATSQEDINEKFKLQEDMDSIKWELPTWIAELKTPLAKEFIISKIDRENRILKSMENSRTVPESDREAIRNNILYLENLL